MKQRYYQNPQADNDTSIIVLLIIPLLIGVAIFLIKWKPLHEFLTKAETQLLNYQQNLSNKKKGKFETYFLYPCVAALNVCSFTLTKNVKNMYLKNAVKTTSFMYVFGIILSIIIGLLTSVLFLILGCGVFLFMLWLAYKMFLGSDSSTSYSPASYSVKRTITYKSTPITSSTGLFDTTVGEIRKDDSGNEEVIKKGIFSDEKVGKIEKGLTGDKYVDNEGNEGEIKTPLFGKSKIIDKEGNEIGEYDKT